MKTTVLKFPLLLALLAWAALAPRPAAAQPGSDSYVIMVRPGMNLIANHLDSGDNTLNQVLPVVAPGSHLLKWDEAAQSFHTDDYQGALGGWTDSTGMPSTTTLGAREAAFLVNPGTTAYPLTISGNSRTNGPPPPLTRGVLHYVSRATKGIATFAEFYCCNPVDDCSLFLRWNPATQTWLTNMFSACHWSMGDPVANIGEGVAIWLPPVAQPLVVCPPDLTVFGCDPETPVSYRASYGTNRWISCFPPSGTLFALGTSNVTCTATNDCGVALSNSFKVTVRPPVAQWPWPSPLPGIGIPVEPVGGATIVYPPAGSSSTTGPSLEIIPNAAVLNSGVRLRPGPAQAITFTTVLDFTAPEGAGIDLKLPPSTMNTNDIPLLSFRSKGKKGYCVKTIKAFADDPSGEFRLAMVNTNGQLLNPVTLTTAEMRDTEYFVLAAQPGVTSCHVTVELSLLDGSITLEFDGPVTAASGRKGWDGCIYGPDRPIKKAQARFYVGPPPFPGAPPITELLLVARGVAEIVIEEPTLTASGRKWGDGHVTLMKAYDDGVAERGMQFTPLAEGGGVTIDTGYSSSFNVRLHHLEAADSPGTEELLTRTIGPIRGLTNRPPPPFLDALMMQANASLGGVDVSADFSNLGSPTVRVQIFNQGMLVTERAGVPATLGNPLFTMSDWPERLGKLGGATPCRRGKPPFGAFLLPGGGGLPPVVVVGDEFRVLAELAPAAPHPNYYSGFELLGSAGATWAVTQLQTTSALSPPTATITAGPDGLTIDGATEGFGYFGATSVTGPFYDLGVVAGTVTGTNTTPIKLPPLRESPSLIWTVRESPTRCCRGGNPY